MSRGACSPHPLGAEDRATLAALLAREAALVFDAGLEPRLADAAQRAARELGEAGGREVVGRAAQGDRRAIEALLSAALVGETWFFRDLPRMALVRDRFVPEALAARGRARLWSVACASGEEAWSLAAMALSVRGASASRIEVLGTDLDARALERARRGVYRPWSLRQVPDDLRERWLEPVEEPGGTTAYRVSDELRGVVAFERVNLVDVARGSVRAAEERWDVIFCRNVLMYLEPEVQSAVLLRLAGALEEGGALVLGAAEPPLPAAIAHWADASLGGNVLVRSHGGQALAAPRAARLAPPAPARRRTPSARSEPPPPVEPPAAPAGERDLVDEALALADAGSIEAAIHRLEPHDADARALAARALLLESADRTAEAACCAERALVLDPSRVEAAIVAARARARLNDRRAALRHVRRARRAASMLARDASLELLPETSRATMLALLDAFERMLDTGDVEGTT